MTEIAILGWLGLAVTLVINAAIAGVVVGTMRSAIRANTENLRQHEELKVPQAHGCSYFSPQHREG